MLRQLDAVAARKALRSKHTHLQVLAWRRANVPGKIAPSKSVRLNELHYPRPFLLALKALGKVKIPSAVDVSFAKRVGMYREHLVVGKQVLTVPNLTAAQVRALSIARRGTVPVITSPCPAPATSVPLITSPISTPATSVSPITTPVPHARASHDCAGTKNILVVGLVSQLPRANDAYTDTQRRDHLRLQWLRKRYRVVITLACHSGDNSDPASHVDGYLNGKGATKVVDMLHQRGVVLHRICCEYVRFPSVYYSRMILGPITSKFNGRVGAPVLDFVRVLHIHNVLAAGCTMQFARHAKDHR